MQSSDGVMRSTMSWMRWRPLVMLLALGAGCSRAGSASGTTPTVGVRQACLSRKPPTAPDPRDYFDQQTELTMIYAYVERLELWSRQAVADCGVRDGR